MERYRKLIAIAAIPLSILSGFVIYLISTAGPMPEEIVVRWGPDGQPDGYASATTFAIAMIGLCLILTALLGVIATTSSGAIGGRGLVALPAALVAFIVAISVGTTLPQLDGGSVETLPGWVFPIAVVAAMGSAMLAWVLAGPPDQPETTNSPAPADADRIELPPQHTVIWSGATPLAPIFFVLGIITAIVGIGMAIAVNWWLLVLFIPISALLAASASYRVTIGRNGVEAAARGFGWPRLRIPLEQITRGDTGTVRALDYGGWGIRICRPAIGKPSSAVVTRSGPALIITRTDHAELKISLDKPHEAASVLSTLLDRRADSQSTQ